MKFKKIIVSLLSIISIITLVSCTMGQGEKPPVEQPPVEEVAKYTVTFHSVGGSAISSVKTNDEGKINSPANPTKEGYKFAGWYTDTTYETKVDVSKEVFTSNTILYAKWTKETYTITFETNGGTNVESVEVEYLDTVSLKTPSKAGYSFVGWYQDKDLTTKFDSTTKLTSNVTLYAKWEKIVLNVSFNTNGGSDVETIKVDYNKKLTLPENPTKVGHTFVGWYQDTSLTNEFNVNTSITKDITLYAKWEINVYKVSFETNSSTVISDLTVVYNNKVNLPQTPTKEGYSFVGWYQDKDLTVEFDKDTLITSNITLYAKWVDEIIYTVSFETNGGTEITKISVVENNVIDFTSINPQKPGYEFVGWYIDSALKNKFDVDTKINSDLTLYAKWKEIKEVTGNDVVLGEAYYGSLYGLSNEELKKELHKILEKTHTTKLSYSDVWGALKVADKGVGDNVVCIYTGVLHAFSKQDTGSAGADIWNREHVWPNSKGFGNKSHTAYSDIHHLFASNKNINNTRSNKDYGDFDLLGISSYSEDEYGNKWNGTYFEPRDEVKGDLARAIFYMVVRYDGDTCNNCTLDLELVVGSSGSSSNTYDVSGKFGDLKTLIKWHYEDPVSEQELARNEVVYSYQGNRNPFIDHPEFIYSLYTQYAQSYVN